MIITIDGPAGAGKSSAARALAGRLGIEFLDTGAMYRAVALAALRRGIDLGDETALGRLVDGLVLELRPHQVLLCGEDVTSAIRTAEVTAATGPVADSPAVRRRLVQLQRRIAAGRDFVCEGRDQGTVVFPGATCKFFLTADPHERALRRQRDMAARCEAVELSAVLAAQEARDRRDAERDLAPMRPAADAIIVDSTHLRPDEVVARMEAEVRMRVASSQ
jgi:cytidylate kinase